MTSHGYGFGQEQLHVPVVFRGPGVPAGVRIGTPISLVDVAPTLLEVARAEPLSGGQGVSLAPAFSGEALPGDRPVFFAWIQPGAAGYRLGDAKVAQATGMSVVYDLEKDPLETERHGLSPLPEAERAVLDAHLADAARRREETQAATVDARAPEPITEKMKKSLEALGYVD